MIVVDTSVWIDYLRASPTSGARALGNLAKSTTLILGDLVLFELLRGARDDRHGRIIEAQMRAFALHRMVDPDLAVTAGRYSRKLRSVGVTPRKSVDLLIATFCIERGHELLHRDRDFDLMALHLDLRILDTSAFGTPS